MSSRIFLGELLGTRAGPGFDLRHPVDSFVDTAPAVAFHPVVFFSTLARRGNYVDPLAFAVICAEIAVIPGPILGLLAGYSVAAFITSVVLSMVGKVVELFIIAGLAHLLVMLVVKTPNSGFEATFRVASYAWVTSLVSWIPLIGPFLGLYGLYLAIVGIREMHQTTTEKAALVVLIPVLATLVIIVLVTLAVGIAMLMALR